MNQLDTKRRTQIIAALVEGNSVRSTCRMTGTAKGTVLKLLAQIGEACQAYQDKKLRNLNSKVIQCDEIWSFCYAKDKNVPKDKQGTLGFGDIWTWTALDADSKLAVSWVVGRRDRGTANFFIRDLANRLNNRVQLTTDSNFAYLNAIKKGFKDNVDYSTLRKLYGVIDYKDKGVNSRYSPPMCIGIEKRAVLGRPDINLVSTSYVERNNLNMRMGMRRFTRLTNGFSKKLDNLRHAVALHFMYYNFCRIHQSIRVTPAMEAGIADRVWELKDVVDLIS